MRILKSCCIAFSIYSKIPMPQFEWKERDMQYMLCFFSWIGLVIGGVNLLWFWLCQICGVGRIAYALIGSAIPLLISGGFHVDGYMDTMDAFHSYQPKERKLEILKDPHIGAFSVIMLVLYYMIYIGAYSEILNWRIMAIVSLGYAMSRTFSGIAVVRFKNARGDGMLQTFSGSADRRWVFITLLAEVVIYGGMMLWLSPLAGCIVVLSAVICFGYYYKKCQKELGGITGDTAGWFVTVCECVMLATAAVISILM